MNLHNETNLLNNITSDNTSHTGHEVLLTEQDLIHVGIIKIISSVLSLIGTTFIITIYIYLSIKTKCTSELQAKPRSNSGNRPRAKSVEKNEENHHTLKMGYGHNLIFLLSLSDFLYCISAFIKTSGFEHREVDMHIFDNNCIIQGVILNFSEISSICWTSMISFSIYLGTFAKDITQIPKIYFYFFIYAYGLPLLFTIGPLITNSYGPAGAWCWMNTQNLYNSSAWIWALCIYIFNWSNIAFNIFAVVKSVNYFQIRGFEVKEENQQEANFLKNFCIVLKFFPMILIVCWFFPTINRIYLFISRRQNAVLFSLQIFFGSLTGFLNSLVYSYYYKNVIPCWSCFNFSTSDSKAEKINQTGNSENSVDMKNITPPSLSLPVNDKNVTENQISYTSEKGDFYDENSIN